MPIVFVKPQDRQVVKDKFDHLFKTRDRLVNSAPTMRLTQDIHEFLRLQQVRDIEGNLTQLLQKPEGQPLLKIIHEVN